MNIIPVVQNLKGRTHS